MGIDTSGNKLYEDIVPFSREVCINPYSICEVDGAVLFASKKGLMIATLNGVQEFIPNLNGRVKHLPSDTGENGIGMKYYLATIKDYRFTQLYTCISYDDFRRYISDENTVITYASEKNKIVVYNKTKPYIYWIDIPTRTATKIPIGIRLDNNDYPTELYVKNDGTLVSLGENLEESTSQVLLQSRPIKIDGGWKSSIRVILRGWFEGSEHHKAALLVLGSYNGKSWFPIGEMVRDLKDGFTDLGCDTERVSVKYIMIIASGQLNSNSHIDSIELSSRKKYNNKLK
jgi:hypothetical protein